MLHAADIISPLRCQREMFFSRCFYVSFHCCRHFRRHCRRYAATLFLRHAIIFAAIRYAFMLLR